MYIETNKLFFNQYYPTTNPIGSWSDLIYRQKSMGIQATNSLTDLSEKICLTIFQRTTLCSHQSYRLQCYTGFRPVLMLTIRSILLNLIPKS